eukprot:PhM_4_TR8865/c0_g1_i1/m.98048/K15889/PCME; prenylcysteine alpha-carboxyl methylesterase
MFTPEPKFYMHDSVYFPGGDAPLPMDMEASMRILHSGGVATKSRSVKEVVMHVMKQVYLIAKWTCILLMRLGLGYKWVFMAVRTILFAGIISSVVAKLTPRYFFDPRVIRSVPYGTHGRNRLDILLPIPVHEFVIRRDREPMPVIVFITGGAWIIGYKAWGFLFGLQAIQRNALFITADYRNYPQGTMSDMLDDVSHVLEWVSTHVALYGGDPNNITVVGQSAGGHLTTLALLRQAQRTVKSNGSTSWKGSDFKRFVGLSGVYDISGAEDYLHKRGLYRWLLRSIVGARHKSSQFCPMRAIESEYILQNAEAFKNCMPREMIFLHGDQDKSSPLSHCRNFVESLKAKGLAERIILEVQRGKAHTDTMIEDIMDGDMTTVDYIVTGVLGRPQVAPSERLAYAWQTKLARFVNSF